MRKYQHAYMLHTPPCKPPSPHLTFGAMAHEVLYNAGRLRDDTADGVVEPGEYYQVIPSEVLYGDLKEEFGIKSWQNYFTPVIKRCAQYEKELITDMREFGDRDFSIFREHVMSLTPDQLSEFGIGQFTDIFKGIIDLLIVGKTHAIIIDYKFSNNRKTQQNFDMDSQLQLYALFVHLTYDIPLHNIEYGYIDIPKTEFGLPTILSNGLLSRSKSQNVSQEFYKQAVEAIHGNDPVYNCEPGGYYYDCYCNLALNQPAYMNIRYLDEDAYKGVLNDLFDTARMIEVIKKEGLPYLAKYDSYSCSGCEYVNSCKPWTVIGTE